MRRIPKKRDQQYRHKFRLEVHAQDGIPIRYFKRDLVFKGNKILGELPVSYSEKPGRYTIVAENIITGQKAAATFDVVEHDRKKN